MYDPVKDGVAKTVKRVVYAEAPPPAPLGELVHCFWELRTATDLADDFTLHAVPDACVNLLFDQHDTRIAGVTRLHTSHTTLDLGRSFHLRDGARHQTVADGRPERPDRADAGLR